MNELEELRRIAAHTGSVGDEAAYLEKRVELGELSKRQLELAAFLGNEAAILVAGEPGTAADLMQWIGALSCWGKEAVVRALFVLSENAYYDFLAEDRQEELPPILKATLAWLKQPSEKVVSRLNYLGNNLITAVYDVESPNGNVVCALAKLALLISSDYWTYVSAEVFHSLHQAYALDAGSQKPRRMIQTQDVDQQLREMIRAGLSSWVLGCGDSLLGETDSS